MRHAGEVQKRKHRKLPVFFQYLFSHLVLIAVFVIGLALINLGYFNILKGTIEEASRQELKKAADMFESRLYELSKSALSLAREESATQIAMARNLSIDEYTRLYELGERMTYGCKNNQMIDRLLLYFIRSGSAWVNDTFWDPQMVVSSDQNYRINAEPFDVYFQNKESARSGAAASSGLEYVTVTENGQQKNQFMAYFSLYPLSNYKVQAYVGFLLDMEYCEQFFSFGRLQEKGAFRLLDAQGEALYCSENAPQSIQDGAPLFGDENMMLFSYQPEGSRYTYQLFVFQAEIYSSVWKGLRTSLAVSCIALCIAAGLAFWLAQNNARPVAQLVQLAQPERQGHNEWSVLHDSIRALMQDRTRMEESLSRQLELQRNTVISRIFSYEFRSDEAALEALAQVELMPEHTAYSAVYLHFVPQEGMEEMTAHVMLSGFLRTLAPDIFYAYMLHNRAYVLLCKIDEKRGVDRLRTQLEEAVAFIRQEYHFDMACAIGLPRQSLLEWPESLKSARRAYHNRSTAQNLVFVAEKGQDVREQAWKMQEVMRHQLISLCQAGDYAMIVSVIGAFFDEQSALCSPDRRELTQLCYDFRSLLMTLLIQVPGLSTESVSLYIDGLLNADSPDGLRADILSIFHTLCTQVSRRREESAHSVFGEVRAYIQAHFTDQDLSLSSIADAFNMNEKYLSQLYKKESGVNLTAEIEELRLKHAVYLMADTEAPLTEIYALCGYGSLNSFYKAFKRVYALSPSIYRKGLKLGGKT